MKISKITVKNFMNPSIFTVNTNLNITSEKSTEQRGDLRYLFLIRESKNDDLCFSVVLKNSGHAIINQVWFSTFIGIGNTKFAPGWDDQDKFHIKSFLGQYLSGYTKESFKFPPETILEILYFEIPKNKLAEDGSLEFFYGCESIKKISFSASWTKNEIKNKLKEINTQNFINFVKYKNQKTCFKKISLFVGRVYKSSKRLIKNFKNCLVKEVNF